MMLRHARVAVPRITLPRIYLQRDGGDAGRRNMSTQSGEGDVKTDEMREQAEALGLVLPDHYYKPKKSARTSTANALSGDGSSSSSGSASSSKGSATTSSNNRTHLTTNSSTSGTGRNTTTTSTARNTASALSALYNRSAGKSTSAVNDATSQQSNSAQDHHSSQPYNPVPPIRQSQANSAFMNSYTGQNSGYSSPHSSYSSPMSMIPVQQLYHNNPRATLNNQYAHYNTQNSGSPYDVRVINSSIPGDANGMHAQTNALQQSLQSEVQTLRSQVQILTQKLGHLEHIFHQEVAVKRQVASQYVSSQYPMQNPQYPMQGSYRVHNAPAAYPAYNSAPNYNNSTPTYTQHPQPLMQSMMNSSPMQPNMSPAHPSDMSARNSHTNHMSPSQSPANMEQELRIFLNMNFETLRSLAQENHIPVSIGNKTRDQTEIAMALAEAKVMGRMRS